MDTVFDTLLGVFGDKSALIVALLVFLAAATLAFGLMAAARVRGSVKRRAAGIAQISGHSGANEQGSLRQSSLKAAQRVLDYTTKHYSSTETIDMKVIRQRLVRAGIY